MDLIDVIDFIDKQTEWAEQTEWSEQTYMTDQTKQIEKFAILKDPNQPIYNIMSLL